MAKRNNRNNRKDSLEYCAEIELSCPICGGSFFLWKCIACGWEGPEPKEEVNPSKREIKRKKKEYTIRSDT